jgi:LCP family protein required for cell wall assembly
MTESSAYLNQAKRRQQRAARTPAARGPGQPQRTQPSGGYQPAGQEAARPYSGKAAKRRRSTPRRGDQPQTPRRGRSTINLQLQPADEGQISLPVEFDRARRAQRASRRRSTRRPRRPWVWIAIGVPALALVIAAVIIGPVLYEGTRAYQNVFVDQVPHDSQPPLAVVNSAGTPVIPTAQPNKTQAQQPVPDWNGKERITLLLIGIDRRKDEATRSDTMILVNIDPVTKKAAIMSIPRDMKLIIPGYGVQKINAAYAYGDANNVPGGGPGLTIRTIEANFGIRINYFAEVDFNGFIKIVDTLGGVTLDVRYPIKDDTYPASGDNYMRIYFPSGWQHMDGTRALEYARTRHADNDSMRSERQQQVLLALRQQAITMDLLPKARDLITEVGDSVRTDLSLTQLLQLARLGSQISSDNITSYSLDPALTEEWVPDGPYYLIPDWNICGKLLSEFTGSKVVPPASALAHPDRSIPIRLANGTQNVGLAERVANVLKTNGFTNVTVAPDDAALAEDTTHVIDRSGNLTTALYVAGAIGVGSDAIDVQPSSTTPIASGGPTPDAGGIVVVLGDDAPDPAYFQAIPVDDGDTPIQPTDSSNS